MHEGVCEDQLSRQLCRFVTGQDRLFSAVCYERRWTNLRWFALHWVVNSHFYRLRGEVGHCRAAFQREQAHEMDLPGRARWAGM